MPRKVLPELRKNACTISVMKIIISPAKQMKRREDMVPPESEPVFLDRAQEVLTWLKTLSYDEAKRLWRCSDKLAHANYEALQNLELSQQLTPAVLAYDGIAFKYMAPSVFETGQFSYVQEHLRILSGLYGALRPMDGVVPYRLEMQAKAHVTGTRDLYEYWGNSLYREVIDNSRTLINLASKEYSTTIERYLQPHDRFITCTFAEKIDGRLVQKGVYCKMARGEMVRFMATHNVTEPEQLESFDSPDWRFAPELSSPKEYVFLRR